MAKFSFNGVDYISARFEELAKLSDEDKLSIIRPAATLLLEKQRDKLVSLFRQRTGSLAASLTIEERTDDNGVFALIFPKGKHPRPKPQKRVKDGKEKKAKDGKPARKYYGTNAEVAYILEYGSPRIRASHWMETANEEASDEVVAAEETAWDELLTRKGL